MVWTQESYHYSVNYDRPGGSVLLKRTVSGDIDWRFDNLRGSHYQSQVNCECRCYKSLVVVLIGRQVAMLLVVRQLSRDVIGCEDCKTWLVRFDPSFVSQMSVGLLLVKLGEKVNTAGDKESIEINVFFLFVFSSPSWKSFTESHVYLRHAYDNRVW